MRLEQCLARVRKLSALSVWVLLAACGGGGGGGGGGGSGSGAAVNGQVAAAFVSGATVSVYQVDPATRGLTLLGTSQTGSDGGYSATLGGNGPWLLVASGGTFVDEATQQSRSLGATSVLSSLDDPRATLLEVLIPAGGSGSFQINPLTTLAARRSIERLRRDPMALEDAGQLADAQAVAQEFGLSGDVRALAATDLVSGPSGLMSSDPSTQLALILAGLSQQAQSLGLSDPLSLVDALARDFADGRFDGFEPSATIGQVNPVPLGAGVLAADAGTQGLATAATSFASGPNNNSGLSAASFNALTTQLASRDLPPPGNVAPSFDAVADRTIDEDAGVLMIPISGISANDPSGQQSVSLNVRSSNMSLLSSLSVSAPSGGNATLMVQAAANVSTSGAPFQITVTATDSGGTANGGFNAFSRTFQLQVNAVNDAPTFDSIGDQVALAGSGPQSLPLTGIGSGAPDELDPLSFTLSSNNPSVVPTPTISFSGSTGTLSYTPLIAGVATITVTLSDGQSLNGSFSRSFMITVQAGGGAVAIGSIVPNQAAANDFSLVRVSTSGFISFSAQNLPTASLGGMSATVTLVDASTVDVTVPSGLSLGAVSLSLSLGGSTATQGGFMILAPVAPGEVLVNEIFPDPAGPSMTIDANGDGNASTTEDEFVELVNLRATAVDVSGFQIFDAAGLKFTMPNPVTIPAGACLVIFGGGAPTGFAPLHSNGAALAGSSGLGLGSTMDQAELRDLSGTSIDLLAYNLMADAISVNRSMDGVLGAAPVLHNTIVGALGNLSPARRVDGTVFGSAQPMLNPPGAAAPAPVTIAEDASAQTLTLMNISANDAGQQVTSVTASSSDPSIIPNPSVSFTAGAATASLSFTPVANAFTTASPVTITLTLTDNGSSNNSATLSFNVTVTAVNDAPSFAAVGNQSAVAGSGNQNLTINMVSPGPGESESVSLTVSSSNTSVVPTPTISGTGASRTLTYNPAQAGVSTITLAADDGQATNNTFSQSFTITVQASGGSAQVMSVVPALAATTGGTLVRVTTAGFTSDFTVTAPSATLAGMSASLTVINANSFDLSVPSSLTLGLATIQVTAAAENASFANFSLVAPVGVGEVIVNEVFADPASPSVTIDANGDGTPSTTQDEFVELVNLRTTPVDLSGFQIFDAAGLKFTMPNPVTIPAGGALVVFGGGTPTGFAPLHSDGAALAGTAGLGLGSPSDQAELRDASGLSINLLVYTNSTDAISVNRMVDGDGAAAPVLHNAVSGAVGDLSPGKRVSGLLFTSP